MALYLTRLDKPLKVSLMYDLMPIVQLPLRDFLPVHISSDSNLHFMNMEATQGDKDIN